jgi:ribonuclease HI
VGKKQKYYVVWKGRHTGIYHTWEDCSAQIAEFPDAQYKSFASQAEAEEALRGRYEDYTEHHEPDRPRQSRLAVAGSPILESYAVDAACSGNPGPVEYRCVHVRTGQEVFKQGPFPKGTNNIGEFLAIVHALALFKQQGITAPIYSDSENAILWVKHQKCRTKLARDDENARLFDLIERAETWLRSNEYANEILKWETDAWGEIPADFGRK